MQVKRGRMTLRLPNQMPEKPYYDAEYNLLEDNLFGCPVKYIFPSEDIMAKASAHRRQETKQQRESRVLGELAELNRQKAQILKLIDDLHITYNIAIQVDFKYDANRALLSSAHKRLNKITDEINILEKTLNP